MYTVQGTSENGAANHRRLDVPYLEWGDWEREKGKEGGGEEGGKEGGEENEGVNELTDINCTSNNHRCLNPCTKDSRKRGSKAVYTIQSIH